ncbi:MAG: HEAT repeat domain-containing protein [Anaerolineaceae bacterium]|nr:MAG: HEAT repeat domain-containing protein [Anaerolineaceae bacterium]
MLGEIQMTTNEQIERALAELESGDVERRAEAIAVLGDAGHHPAALPLSRMLPDVDPGTRYLIVKALGQIAHSATVEPLLAAMRYDDIWTRAAATSALINIGTPQAVAGLIDALRDANKAVRRAAAKAIGKIGATDDEQKRDVVRGLSAALLDVDEGVRRFAAEALGRVNATGKVDELTETLRDASAEVRIAAFRALAQIDTPEARSAVRRWAKDQ